MRVLHINCNYMTTALHQTMIEHLDKTGVESHVFAPVYDAGQAVIKPNKNVTVAECFRKWDRLHFGYKQRKIISAVEKELDVSQFDCLHAYTLFTDGNCAMKLSQKYRIPYVVAVRSTDMNDFLRLKPWLRGRAVQIMENASVVFFLSPRYMEDMISKYVPAQKRDEIRSKSQVVPNGINDFWLEHKPEPISESRLSQIRNRKINIVVAGRINRNKNQIAVMHAVDKLNAEGWQAHLTVVGPTEDSRVSAMLDRNPAVTVLPAQPKEKLLDIYRANDIFVLPSFQETFGLVYAEAMSQGLPVLYTKGQGFDGQFPEGFVGFSVKADDVDEVAKKIQTVVDRYQAISSNGYRSARQFNWSDIVNRYSSIYGKITSTF